MLPSDLIKVYRSDIVLFCKEELRLFPDPWQEKVLKSFADGRERIKRIAMRACVGPGKSCTMAASILWSITTQSEVGNHFKGACVSITGENLRDGLWSEVAKWRSNSEFLTAAFEMTSERLYARGFKDTWFVSARTFPKYAAGDALSSVLSGLHSPNIGFWVDEAGGLPVALGKSAEQALSTQNLDFARLLISGNPLDRISLLGNACLKEGYKWDIHTITNDPDALNRSPRVSKEWAQDQIGRWGRDDPWVQAHVLSVFPENSINTLLSQEEVEAAKKRSYAPEQYSYAQKRIGVDVAGGGLDSNVLFPRQGLVAFNPVEIRHCPSQVLAMRIVHGKIKWGCETVIVDNTGGWGGGTVDCLNLSGHYAYGINFAEAPDDKRYFNKRAEMYWRLATWVKQGGSIPDNTQLASELSNIQYTFKDGRFMLERKQDLKRALGGQSPDRADALALTFALPPALSENTYELGSWEDRFCQESFKDYNPFASL